MRTYRVADVQELRIKKSPGLEGHYLMSPFVWLESGRHRMALRVVEPKPDGSWGLSRIIFAEGDGLEFEIMDVPALVPGPWPEDSGGSEDPTVFFHDSECCVYYTGWNSDVRQAQLLCAAGPDISALEKRGAVLHGKQHWNTKEATVAEAPDRWWLFYEYSEIEHSLIGRAWSNGYGEEWHPENDLFGLREDHWDSWHLSTGPMALRETDRPVMFYNGADKSAHWRIGWIEFDAGYTKVIRRADEPLVAPQHLPSDFLDIAFAASAVEVDAQKLELYFSVGDQKLCKATIEIGE